MDTHIAHFDLDTFFVSVERLLDRSLLGRPVIVGGNPFGRGVVAGCSYEARAYGIHSAQPIRTAHRLCPNAVFLFGDDVHYIHYAEYGRLISEMLHELVPLCERSSVDEFYLDLSRTESLKGNTYRWAQEIRKTVLGETNLPISFGLARNKLVAKVATTQISKRSDERHFNVPLGREREFLAPFPVRALPGIGAVAEQQITTLGLETIGQLATTPPQVLQRLFGNHGKAMNQRANGIDLTPVIETREQKSFSRSNTFTEDTTNTEVVFANLLLLASQLAQDLRKAKRFAARITLTIRYSDFSTYSKAVRCSYTHNDRTIYEIVKKALRQLWTRRQRLRLVGIEASDLIEDIEQQALFEFKEEAEEEKMNGAIDLLRAKYGNAIIKYAGAKAA
jgi:DNA polymerase IV